MNGERLIRVRRALRDAELDGLLITHPPNIRYLTGLQASAGAALLLPDTCRLVVDPRYETAARMRVEATADLSLRVAGGQIDAALVEELSSAGPVRVGVEGEHLSLARFNRLVAGLEQASGIPAALASTERIVERLRAVKDAAEIATLREAARRLSGVARRAREFVRPGLSEIEVAARVDSAMRDAGFEAPAFDTIVASGPNSALPHARPTSRPLSLGEGVVLDFGGIYDGYCVDLTRTLHLGGVPAENRRLFEAVRAAFHAAVAAVRPGALPVEIDAAARTVLEQHGLGAAFGHSTGHGLGLEVHEEPRISRHAPAGEPVVAGMVFTIEPGAYVPGTGGVRIEDDVLVVDGGCEVLTDVPVDFGEG